MRLSEALLLGAATAKHPLENSSWRYCLCGMAVSALTDKENLCNHEAELRWPWLNGNIEGYPLSGRCYLTSLCFDVMEGRLTIEQVADLIRKVEPVEPSEPTETITETTDVHLRDLQKV
jgi:hypothetical protein